MKGVAKELQKLSDQKMRSENLILNSVAKRDYRLKFSFTDMFKFLFNFFNLVQLARNVSLLFFTRDHRLIMVVLNLIVYLYCDSFKASHVSDY